MKRLFVVLVVLMLASCGGATDAPAKEPTPTKHTFDSLQAAMDSGLGMKCTFNYEGEKAEALVNGDKYHTTVRSEGQLAHVVSDGSTLWVWEDSQKEGFYVTKADFEEAGEEMPKMGVVEKDKKIDYTCFPMIVSGTSFQPPEDVKFISLKEMMEALMEGLFS